MFRILMRISPPLACLLKGQGTDWLVLEKELREGTTVRDLLTEAAPMYDGFRQVVFDPDTGQIGAQILVILNDELLLAPDVLETGLKNGDEVMLTLFFEGG